MANTQIYGTTRIRLVMQISPYITNPHLSLIPIKYHGKLANGTFFTADKLILKATGPRLAVVF